jgi:hypothetical protein
LEQLELFKMNRGFSGQKKNEGVRATLPRQALRTLSRALSWSRLPVLGAISWAFIAKSYQNLQN